MQMKDRSRELMRKYKCNPVLTVLVPILVNVPLFLLLSTAMRYGCVPPTPWAGEYAPFPWAAPSTELVEKFQATTAIAAEKGASPEELEALRPRTGPSLVERDSTGFGSLILGMTYLLATEVGAYRRRIMNADGEVNAANKAFPSEMVAGGKSSTSASVQAPAPAPASAPATTSAAAATAGSARGPAATEAEKGLTTKFRENLISNIMRVTSIVFIVISSQVPSVRSPSAVRCPCPLPPARPPLISRLSHLSSLISLTLSCVCEPAWCADTLFMRVCARARRRC